MAGLRSVGPERQGDPDLEPQEGDQGGAEAPQRGGRGGQGSGRTGPNGAVTREHVCFLLRYSFKSYLLKLKFTAQTCFDFKTWGFMTFTTGKQGPSDKGKEEFQAWPPPESVPRATVQSGTKVQHVKSQERGPFQGQGRNFSISVYYAPVAAGTKCHGAGWLRTTGVQRLTVLELELKVSAGPHPL